MANNTQARIEETPRQALKHRELSSQRKHSCLRSFVFSLVIALRSIL